MYRTSASPTVNWCNITVQLFYMKLQSEDSAAGLQRKTV